MSAPTWTDELHENAELSGATDIEAERAILRAYLFGEPPKQLGDLEAGTTLHSLQRRLESWLHMLSTCDFKIAPGAPAGTDGTHIFLPPALPLPSDSLRDAALYRWMAFFQLRLLEGKFLEDRALLGELYQDWSLRSCYHLLVAQWIVADGARRFPGLREDLSRIQDTATFRRLRVNLTEVPSEGLPGPFVPLYDGLTALNGPGTKSSETASSAAVLALRSVCSDIQARLAAHGQAHALSAAFRSLRLGPPPVPDYLGLIRPEWILGEEARSLETNEDWREGQLPLRRLRSAMKKGRKGALSARLREKMRQRMSLPDEASVSQLPAYGPARDAARAKLAETPDTAWRPGQSPEALTSGHDRDDLATDGYPHQEWDFNKGAYNLNATRVRSPLANSGPLENYHQIALAHRREIAQIRQRFEALRVEERWVGRQIEGPEVDLEAAIRARTDILSGHQPNQMIFRRFVRQRRDLCAMTLVDLSGSTKGSILYEQQRAIILFSEALQSLALPHSFYGFNGTAPHDCILSQIKGFAEGYDEAVYRRLGNLRAEGGTRLGAHIREASRLLSLQPQGRRLLLLLSDGRPEARGEYRGDFGQRDSEMAVREARRLGVVVHCISMDASGEAPRYLRAIFGVGHYHLIEQAEALPLRLPEVFRALVK